MPVVPTHDNWEALFLTCVLTGVPGTPDLIADYGATRGWQVAWWSRWNRDLPPCDYFPDGFGMPAHPDKSGTAMKI